MSSPPWRMKYTSVYTHKLVSTNVFSKRAGKFLHGLAQRKSWDVLHVDRAFAIRAIRELEGFQGRTDRDAVSS